jgi:tetratricopeptide (TPR) repeat protein
VDLAERPPGEHVSGEAEERARALFDAGEFADSRAEALRGLSSDPDNVELLVLAGQAGVELDASDAVEQLQRATALAPDDARAWHHLGEALAADGRMSEANDAFKRTVELDPDDQVALSHLGHTSLATGRGEEGVGYLARAAESTSGMSTAAISLVDMYRSFGQYEDALAQARRITQAIPDDVPAQLDVAELSLIVGQLDDASGAFDRLRELDDVPGHEAYPLYGLISVEIRRERWDRAQQLAAQAATIDPHGLTTDVAAFLAEQVSGPGEEPAPTQAEVEAALNASLAEYRRMHADDRRLSAGDADV